MKLLPRLPDSLRQRIAQCLPHVLPFADAASAGLPLPRLLRLSLFQVSVGLAAALMVGTLNRGMIVVLHMAAWLVSLMVALPLLAAPFRAFVGHRSDTPASAMSLDATSDRVTAPSVPIVKSSTIRPCACGSRCSPSL